MKEFIKQNQQIKTIVDRNFTEKQKFHISSNKRSRRLLNLETVRCSTY